MNDNESVKLSAARMPLVPIAYAAIRTRTAMMKLLVGMDWYD